MSGLLSWVRANPGTALAYTVIVLAFGLGLLVASLEGWIGAPPYRANCAVVTRTGDCS